MLALLRAAVESSSRLRPPPSAGVVRVVGQAAAEGRLGSFALLVESPGIAAMVLAAWDHLEASRRRAIVALCEAVRPGGEFAAVDAADLVWLDHRAARAVREPDPAVRRALLRTLFEEGAGWVPPLSPCDLTPVQQELIAARLEQASSTASTPTRRQRVGAAALPLCPERGATECNRVAGPTRPLRSVGCSGRRQR